jgi:phospholipid-translocating P-type ATPase (flippase)
MRSSDLRNPLGSPLLLNIEGGEMDEKPLPRHVVLDSDDSQYKLKYPNNEIRTAKYTTLTFLPKFLFEEFSKVANFYFFVVCCLQCVKVISNTNGVPSLAPVLFFIVFVDAVFTIIEDHNRHLDDERANNALVKVYNPSLNVFEPTQQKKVRVTDIVKVEINKDFPADMILIMTSEQDKKLCYVETKSLDGETNLKQREAHGSTCDRLSGAGRNTSTDEGLASIAQELRKIGLVVNSEEPNANIHKFEANIGFSNESEQAPVLLKSVALRGCTLRQTSWVIGIAVQTGVQTKIMKSVPESTHKNSEISKSINTHILYLVGLLVGCILISTVDSFTFNYSEKGSRASYLYLVGDTTSSSPPAPSGPTGGTFGFSVDTAVGKATYFATEFFLYFLLMYNMIPVSLYVSMTTVKAVQARFIEWDTKIYHADTNTPTKVRNMNLNEELGRVTHIFSDKTGTLTCNVMEFRKCVVNGRSYGRGTTEIGLAAARRKREGEAKEAAAKEQQEKAGNGTAGDGKSHASYGATFARVRPKAIGSNETHPFNGSRSSSAEEIEERRRSSEMIPPAVILNAERIPNCNLDAPDLEDAIKGGDQQARKIVDFFKHLSLSHTVTPQYQEGATPAPGKTDVEMSASSPDELAMVAGAKFMGFEFFNKALGWKEIYVDQTKRTERYDILAVLEFNSDRKRMSIVVKDKEGRLLLLTKGADTTVFPRIKGCASESQITAETHGGAENQFIYETKIEMEKFAEEGLRTLIIGQRVLSDRPAFDAWNKQYVAACADTTQIELHNKSRPNKIDSLMDELEADLELLGATAIEDKLQDGVPGCIHNLAQGGVKIWVCTGDKEETAINIASACQLLDTTMRMIIVNLKEFPTKQSIKAMLMEETKHLEEELKNAALHPDIVVQKRALVIDGQAMIKATDDPTDDENTQKLTAGQWQAVVKERDIAVKQHFKDFACQCHAVVCCRVSPQQKADMVELIKGKKAEYPGEEDWAGVPGAVTLGIGDGANDVPMILKAHIGVGISGLEGAQAVNSSDFAIAQFRFLQRLLLVHGRWNYIRTSTLVCYVIYKNIVFVLAQWWFYFAASSGQKFYLELGNQLYNIWFTALPIIFLAVQDQDVGPDVAETHPRLYFDALSGRLYSSGKFWGWVFWSVYEAAVIYWVTASALAYMDHGSMWAMGLLALTSVIIVANIRVALNQFSFKWYQTLVLGMSVGLWFMTATVCSSLVALDSSTYSFQQFGVFQHLTGQTTQPGSSPQLKFFTILPLIIVMCCGPSFFWKGYQRYFDPVFHDVIQTGEQSKGSHLVEVGSWVWKLLTEKEQDALDYSLDNTHHLTCDITDVYRRLTRPCAGSRGIRGANGLLAEGDGLSGGGGGGDGRRHTASALERIRATSELGPANPLAPESVYTVSNTRTNSRPSLVPRFDSKTVLNDAAQMSSFSHDEHSRKMETTQSYSASVSAQSALRDGKGGAADTPYSPTKGPRISM